MDESDIREENLEEELHEEGSTDRDPTRSFTDAEIDAQLHGQPFRVVYQTNNFLLPQIRDLIVGGDAVNLRPEYQRRLTWTETQKSLLIESLLLNVPIPPVFFYENDLARYEVMDGQQRLNAIKEFFVGEFFLRGLTVLSSLNGRRYSALPPRVKRNLDRASISAIVLLQESRSQLKRAGTSRYYELRRFVFERLNTGGKRLNAQEIRNAIYGGEFNDMIVRTSRHPLFTEIWGIPPYTNADPNEYYEQPERQRNYLYKTMGDCQIILRFFALREEEFIGGSMRSMLDKCMERHIEITQERANELGREFVTRLDFAYKLFEGRPFDLSLIPGERRRPSVAIYDAVMVAIDRLWLDRNRILARQASILARYRDIIQSEIHTGRLTGAANTADDVRDRIKLFVQLFSV